MDRRALIVALGLLAGSAQAYVTPSPPPGFGGSPGAWTFNPPTPAQQLGGIIRGPGPSIAGAGASSAAYRLGGGAARALARGVLGGGLVGGVALGLAWLAANCFENQGGQWVRTCGGTPVPQSDGYEYRASGGAWSATREQACVAGAAVVYGAGQPLSGTVPNGAPSYTPDGATYGRCAFPWLNQSGGNSGVYYSAIQRQAAASCPAGWYVTDQGCVQTLPAQTVTPQEVEDEMADKPLPQEVPAGVPYPLDPYSPSIWNPDVGNPPTSRPLRVPQGNPTAIPNTNPQQYRQPVTTWTHAPTADDPWRMDVKPEDVVGESSIGMTGPESVGGGAPSTTPREETPDLCEKNPDIVACQKLGTLEPTPIPNEDRAVGINPDSGWGPGSASCPAPKTFSVQGVQLSMSFEPLCLFASGIRPVVIAMAWFAAGLAFFGFGRKEA